MRAYIYTILLLLFCSMQIRAQQLIGYEWFVDGDPGLGNATFVAITNTDQFDAIATFSSTGMSVGTHQLGIRWKDEAGIWSHTKFTPIIIEPSSGGDLASIEWYQDGDPGFGQGTALAVTNASQINQLESLNPIGQVSQVRNVRFRLKSSDGTWGHSLTTYFIYENQSSFTHVEVQKDTMNGASYGTMYALAGDTIDELKSFSGYTDEFGYNRINMRPKDGNGIAGHFLSAAYFVERTPSPITAIQFDYDTTIMRQTTVLPSPEDTLNGDEDYALSAVGLLPGEHGLQVRLRTSNGVVSHHFRDTISICIPVDSGYAELSICGGDSAMIAGEWRKTEGSYFETLTAVGGCDSVVETALTVIESYFVPQTPEICAGDSIFLEGAWRKTAGVFYDTLASTGNCDSIIESSLNILPLSASSQSESICDGDSIFLAGAWQKEAGQFIDVVSAANGCDSTITTTLTILTVPETNLTEEICQGDSVEIGGTWYQTAQTVEQVLGAANGCDSLVFTEVIVNPLPTVEAVASSSEICLGDSIQLTASGATTYTWSHGGANGSYVQPSSLGEHTYYVTGVDANLCQNEDSTTVDVQDVPTSPSVSGIMDFCENVAIDPFTATGTNVNWYDDINLTSPINTGTTYDPDLTVGTHELYVTDVLGSCESDPSITSYEVFAAPTVDAGMDVDLDEGDSYQLMPSVSNGNSYAWMPSYGLDDAALMDPITSTDSSLTYYLTVSNDDGCVETDSVTIIVREGEENLVISNFVSPNGDGKNDTWILEPIEAFSSCSIVIVDSWGKTVFETEAYQNDWSGTYQGADLPDGNYYYIISCAEEQHTGAITIIHQP